jgi:hypothetical protein
MLKRLAPMALLSLALPHLAAQQPGVHAPDDAVVRESTVSIDIPAIPNAPFSATVVTKWVHIQSDGNQTITFNHRLVARDSSGRVFQERRFFSPAGDVQMTPISELDYQDPNRRQLTICKPNALTCSEYDNVTRNTVAPANIAQPISVTSPNGIKQQNENLGENTLEGQTCAGTRETTVYPAGFAGSQKSTTVVKEFWYSPQLGVNLLTHRIDPRGSSDITFTVTKIQQNEPDPTLFTPPNNFMITTAR